MDIFIFFENIIFILKSYTKILIFGN